MGIKRTHLWMAVSLASSIAAGAVLRMTAAGFRWQPSSELHLLTHVSLFAIVTALFTASTHSWTVRWLFFGIVVILGGGTEFYEHIVGGIPLETPDVLLDTIAAGSALVFTSAFISIPEHNVEALRISPQIVLRRQFGQPIVQRMRVLRTRGRFQKRAPTFHPHYVKLPFLSSYVQG